MFKRHLFYTPTSLDASGWKGKIHIEKVGRLAGIPNIRIRTIFFRQASLARQAFLITPLHGARYKTGKNAYAKK